MSAVYSLPWLPVQGACPVPPGSEGNAIFPLKPKGNSLLRVCATGPRDEATAAPFFLCWSGPKALSLALLLQSASPLQPGSHSKPPARGAFTSSPMTSHVQHATAIPWELFAKIFVFWTCVSSPHTSFPFSFRLPFMRSFFKSFSQIILLIKLSFLILLPVERIITAFCGFH